MNLLVTGGAGFIGSNLIRLLFEKDIGCSDGGDENKNDGGGEKNNNSNIAKLVNLDCLTYAGHLENLEGVANTWSKYVHEKVDLRDREQVARVVREHAITHVIHLAAESHVDRSIAAPADFVSTNIVGTFNLLEACRACWFAPGGKKRADKTTSSYRFLHVSTDEVYGSLGPLDQAFSETTPYAPNSPYSASKASSDMLVRAYHHTYGLPTLVTNCSNNYGPYQYPEKLIPVVIQSVLARKPIPVYGDGLNVRDWLYVRDHAEALWLVLCKGRPGESYNVGAQNEVANLKLVQMICDTVDQQLACRSPNNSSGSSSSSSRRLISFVQDRPGHDRRYAIDSTKLRRELGWKPAHNFQEGLTETVRWYMGHQDWVRNTTSSL
jgi:dTDP-glucose 4,6-dehydratase